MKNKDKYTNEFIELMIRGDRLAVTKNGAIDSCFYARCNNCIFDTYETCQQGRKEWMNRESEILDEVEKEYLSAVIKPWRSKVLGMSIASICKKEYLVIVLNNEDESELWFPGFKTGTMYQGMDRHKSYTLEELGL